MNPSITDFIKKGSNNLPKPPEIIVEKLTGTKPNTESLKQLFGGDPIVGRRMFAETIVIEGGRNALGDRRASR